MYTTYTALDCIYGYSMVPPNCQLFLPFQQRATLRRLCGEYGLKTSGLIKHEFQFNT